MASCVGSGKNPNSLNSNLKITNPNTYTDNYPNNRHQISGKLIMSQVKQLGWIFSIALALTACTSVQKDTPLTGVEIKPVMNVNHANGSPRIMYLLGRYHQGKLDYQKAIAAYEKALALKSDYVEVHNGLGVIYSIQGQHELSLRHFHKAIDLAPQETYLYNNLGYAHLTQGNFAEAIKSLSKAVSLDPENKRAQLNLAIAQKKNHSDNNAVASHLNSDDSSSPDTQELTKTDTDEGADTINQIHANAASRLISKIPHTDKSIENDKNFKRLDNKNIKLEISNGNGITGMAKQISVFLQQHGVTNMRLTNHPTYHQNQTEIYYRAGNYHLASQINQLLPMQVKLVESEELRHDVQVKILLGQDFSRETTNFNTKEAIQVSQQSIEKLIH